MAFNAWVTDSGRTRAAMPLRSVKQKAATPVRGDGSSDREVYFFLRAAFFAFFAFFAFLAIAALFQLPDGRRPTRGAHVSDSVTTVLHCSQKKLGRRE